MSLERTQCAIVTLLVLISVHCAAYEKRQAESIGKVTEELLRNNDSEKLYENLDDTAKSFTPKAEFLARAGRLVGFMKDADPELRFVKTREGGVNPDMDRNLFYEHRSLGSDGRRIEIEIWVDLNGGVPAAPKLFDVCAGPATNRTFENEHCLTNALRKI